MASHKSYVGKLFSDDHHPTAQATYLAACMEFQTIFGINASTITYQTLGLSDADALKMRTYASSAITSVKSVTPDPAHTANPAKYNLQGQRVGDDYRGIVVTKGRKYLQK